MSMVILCSGAYAKTPYYLVEDDLHIFSIEELCYYLYKNAFLIEDAFFSDSLVTWIREELGLPAIADTLLQYRKEENLLLRSIEYLFLVTGYYGQAECERVKKVLHEGSQLSVYERRKIRADAYCRRQKYALALAEYEELLKTTDSEQVKLRAKLYHNMGVCHAGMFFYDQAAEAFGQAFHTYPNTESYVQLLTALKLGSSQTEYLSYLAEHPESYEDSLEVESRLKQAEEEWEKAAFQDVVDGITNEENISYYEAVKQLLKQAKEEYTSMVNKG